MEMSRAEAPEDLSAHHDMTPTPRYARGAAVSAHEASGGRARRHGGTRGI